MAPQLMDDKEPHAKVEPKPPRQYQTALFSSREIGRVVPIQAYRAEERRNRTQETIGKTAKPASAEAVFQQSLAFATPVQTGSRAEGVRYCNQPVAARLHRCVAAMADLSLVCIALGLVVVILHLAGRERLVNIDTLPYILGFGAVLFTGYKVLWVSAGTDSPGLRWAHLRLLNFDGKPASRQERVRRLLAGCLSVLAGGLGVFWAGVDEETLTWHDHMSKTFLTTVVRR